MLPTDFHFEEYAAAGDGSLEPVRTVLERVHQLSSYCPKKELELECVKGERGQFLSLSYRD